MIIRPLDIQVLIPKSIDVAKTASVNEQQPVIQQQQLSARLKQTVDAQQRQVQTKLSSQQDGRVTRENLDREKQKERHQHEGWEENEMFDEFNQETDKMKVTALPSDPLRGHTIDIKT